MNPRREIAENYPSQDIFPKASALNGTTMLGFNNADLVATNTTPNPGGGSPEVTTTLYDSMLRPYSVIQPDVSVTRSAYLTE